jgi:hypothetical protein
MTLLYSGIALSDHYTHSGGSAEPTCMKGGDPGAANGNNHDILYPLGIDANAGAPGIAGLTTVKCAAVFVESPTFELWGSDQCPAGWSPAYTGLSMGAYHRHNKNNRQCIDNVNYDGSQPHPGAAGLLYSTYIIDNSLLDAVAFPNGRFVKCAVCVMD